MIVVDRSRIETRQSCPRKRWFQYHHGGLGVIKVGWNPDLLIGSAVHHGIEHALRMVLGAQLVGAFEAAMVEDEAGAEAVNWMSKALHEGGLSPQIVETERGFEEVDYNATQRTFMLHLVEALVRGWIRVRLPRLLSDFRILEIEREEAYQLTPDMTFLSRSDFITERKADGTLFIHNLKTTKDFSLHWKKKWVYDQQTLSELLGAEERYGKKFGGVIVEGLAKGWKNIEWPRGSGQRFHNSPLLWAWAGPDNPPFPPDHRIRYEWTDSDGKSRRLGPSYSRRPSYEVGPLRDWIDKVEREEPALLEAQFITLPAVIRSDHEVESWKRSTMYEEYQVADNLKKLEPLNPAAREYALDQLFPKYTSDGRCLGYGDTACSCLGICWGSASPDDPDLYRPRVPNHPKELEYVQITGLSSQGSVQPAHGDNPQGVRELGADEGVDGA